MKPASNNRLQFVHCETLFETRDAAIEYVKSGQTLDRPSLYAEPMILKYGDEANPNIILAIGSVGVGEQSITNKTYFIDFTRHEESIEEICERLDATEADVNKLKELTAKIIEACGLTENGEYIKSSNRIIKDSESLNDAINDLADYVVILEEKLKIRVKDTKTVDLTVEETETSTTLSADVKINGNHSFDETKVCKNHLIALDNGLFVNVGLEYSGNGDTLKLVVNGNVESSANIPTELHVVRGKYQTKDETLILTLSDNSEVLVELKELASEIRVCEYESGEPYSNSPVVLRLDRRLDSIKNKYGDDVYYSLLSADVKIANIKDNILEIHNSGETTSSLYVRGTADNIKYKEGTVETTLNSLNTSLKEEIENRKNVENNLNTFSSNTISAISNIENTVKGNEIFLEPLQEKENKSLALNLRKTDVGTFIQGWTNVSTSGSNILIGGNEHGDALFATVDLLYSSKDNSLKLVTSSKDGDRTKQIKLNDTVLSYDSSKNILKYNISGRPDDDATKIQLNESDLEYNPGSNTLTFTYASGGSKTLQLSSASIVDHIDYSKTEEAIIIYYKTSSGTESVKIPVKDLIEEWEVDNSGLSDTVTLTRTRDISGTDKLSATVNISDDINNMLERKGKTLFVSNEQIVKNAENIAKNADNITENTNKINTNTTAIALLNDGENVEGSVKNTLLKGIESITLKSTDTINIDYVNKVANVKVHTDALNKYLETDSNGLYVGAKVDEAIEGATSGISETAIKSVKNVTVKQHTDNPLTYDVIYQLNNNTEFTAGTINIPKDQFLKEVKYENHILTLVFETESGEKTVNVDLKDLIDIYSAGDGLQLDSNKFSIKINKDEKYLEVTADGLRTKGIDNVIKTAVDAEANIRSGETQFLSGKVETLIDTKQNKLEEGDAIKIVGDIIDVKLDGGHNEDYLKIHSGGLCLTGIDAIKNSVTALSGEVAIISGDVKDEAITSAKTYTDQQIKENTLSGSTTISIQDKVVSVKHNTSDKYLKVGAYGLETQGIDDAIENAVNKEAKVRSGETQFLSGKVDTLIAKVENVPTKDEVYTKIEVDNKVNPIATSASTALETVDRIEKTYAWRADDTATVDLVKTLATTSGFTLAANVNISTTNNNTVKAYSDGLYVGLSKLDYSAAGNELTFTDANGDAHVLTLNSVDVVKDIYFDGTTDELVFKYTAEGIDKETRVNATSFFKGIYGTRIDGKGNPTNITVATALTTDASTRTVTGISANLDVNDIIDNTNSTVTLKKDATQNKIFANVNIAEIPNNILKIDSGTSNNSLYVLGTAENINYEGTKNVKTKIQELEASAITNTTNITILSGDVKDLKTESDNLYKAVGVDKGDSSITTQMAGTNYLGGQINVTNALRKLDELLKESSDGLTKEIQDRKDGDEYISGVVDNLQSDVDVEDTDTIDLTIDSKTVKSGNKTLLKADVKLSTSTDTSNDDGTVVNLIKAKDDGLFFNGSIDYGTF